VDELTWLALDEPGPMIEFLWNKVSDRKVRLFNCACCRGVSGPAIWQAVEVAERYADGRASPDALAIARNTVIAMSADWPLTGTPTFADVAVEATSDQNSFSDHCVAYGYPAAASICPAAPRLLRDIFGPLPFRTVTVNPSWLTWNHGTVPAIARHVYDNRAFHDLPILADALEDAGCTDADILAHCRGGGEHVRGCWVVDLLLGKG
jgi:hypothetical protein